MRRRLGRLFPIAMIARFGAVGLAATATHFAVLSFSVERFAAPPALANALGFAVAVGVTYLGQSYWVFDRRDHQARRVGAFILSALGGSALHAGIMALAVKGIGADYRVGFAVSVLIVSTLTFLINRFWVFAER